MTTSNPDAELLRVFIDSAMAGRTMGYRRDDLQLSLRRLVEQFDALAKVILEADERTQQPIDLNYIAIFKDDWHRIVGKVTPSAKLADLFVSNPASGQVDWDAMKHPEIRAGQNQDTSGS